MTTKRTRRLIFSGTREPLSEQDRATLRTLVTTWAGTADEIGVGDCPTGVDALIREWLPEARVFVADWKKNGRSAGPKRNGTMVQWAFQADDALLIAMPTHRTSEGGGGKGTRDCISQAIAAGIPIVVAPTACKPIAWTGQGRDECAPDWLDLSEEHEANPFATLHPTHLAERG